MDTQETVREVLSLDGVALAALYCEWSESTHLAGWLNAGEPEFARALLRGTWKPQRAELTDYEIAGVATIRRLLKAGLGI